MKGDVHYKWISSGSCATSANTSHLFFGVYGGLSALNNDEVTHIQVGTVGGSSYRLGLESITNDNGYKISPAGSMIDLPPMKVSDALTLQWANDVLGANASATFVVWRRGII